MGFQQSIRSPNPVLSDSVFEMFRMDNKVAILTGGTGGIGYQVARGLAEAGANIALWYNGSSQAESLTMSLEKDFGIKSKAYKCSVQSFDEVRPTYCHTFSCVLIVSPHRSKRQPMLWSTNLVD
jgi:sorbose reductase